jgi:uncharacterized protein YjdB
MTRWSRALASLASVALGVLAACSGSDSTDPDCDAIAAALVSRIEVEPPSATVNLGDSLQLSAAAYSCAGPMSEVNSFTWRSANDGQATVSETGLVKAMASGGAVTIFAAAQGKEGSSAITTRLVPVDRVTVEPSTATVGVNRTSTLTARAFDAQDREITGRPVSWSSGNIGIVTVDETGRITGVAPGGPVAVTATIEGKSAAAQVSVALVPVSTVTVVPPTATIAAGATQQFTATLRDELGNALTGRAVNWTSSDPNIASINASTGLATGNRPGTVTITATSEGRSGTAQLTVNIGAPARLAFLQGPSSVQAGSTMQPAVTVEIQDAAGNRVTTANSQVISLAVTPSSGVTLGGNTATAVNGVATFNSFTVSTAGTYTLTASSAGLTSATSSSFVVTARPATRVAFVQQPTIDTAGKAITPAITVELQDISGARVTTSGVPITIAIGNNPGGSTLGGTLTQNTVNGVATFNNLTLNRSGDGYTLTASATGLTSATSSAFNIVAGAPVRLALVTQPCTGTSVCTAGSILAPSPQFEILDANGNRVTSGTGSNASVTIARTAGPGNAILSGTTTRTAAGGLVTFGDLRLDRSGTGYVLTATSSGLTSAATAAFNVAAGTGSVLSITSNVPASVAVGTTLPTISVQLLDANSNPVTTAGVSVTLSLSPSGTLGGTTSQLTNASGIATFTGLTISAAAGAGYTLVATATNYANDPSNSFSVTPGAGVALAFVSQPTSELAGATITPAVTVEARDAFGNRATSFISPIAVALTTPGGATLGGTTSVNAVAGLATFNTLSVNAGGTFTLTATSGALTPAVSSAFTITPPSFTLSLSRTGSGTGTVTSNPTGISCGADCSEGYASGTTVELSQSPATGSSFVSWTGCTSTNGLLCIVNMTQARSVTASFILNPSITTTTLPLATAGTPYSQTLAVTGGAGPYSWSLAPGDTLATGLSLSSGGLISGTPTAAGQVGFSVVVTDAGSRTDTQALTLDVAAAVNGIASQLGFLVQPTTVDEDSPISPAVRVEVNDANGTRVTSSTASVILVFGTNAGGATLSGNTAQAASGVAIFSNLRVSRPGTGYTLVATSDGLTSATSIAFRVRED